MVEEPRGELVRMKRYYTCASSYQRQMYGKVTAVGEIQVKLAEAGERYLAILEGTQRDYLHLIEHLMRPEDLKEFIRHLSQFEQDLPKMKILDQFLDAYSAWMKGSREPEIRTQLLQLLQELKQMDPAFHPEGLLEGIGKDLKTDR